MEKFVNISLAIIFALALPTTCYCSATDVYITPNGSSQGACTTSPQSPSWFNSSANWGSGSAQIGPGTTVHLCGTFTASAGGTLLSVQGSGSSGSPITLKFESGANLTAPYWGNAAIDLGSYSYITIDGGTSCGPTGSTCNGVIQATASGTNLANQPSSGNAITGSGSNLEIRNLGIYNMYVHDGTVNDTGGSAQCIYLTNNSNWSIHDSTFHDASWCVVLSASGTSSNWSVYNNNIYNIDHGIAVAGNGTSGTISGLKFYGNHIHDHAAWDTTSDSWHHDGIHLYGQNSGQTEAANIYNNQFDGVASNCNPACWTASVFIEENAQATSVNLFNNVFAPTFPPSGGNGALAITSDHANAYTVVNNTFVGSGTGSGVCAYIYQGASSMSGVVFENNIVDTCNLFIWANGVSFATLDRNVYYNGSSSPWRWNGNYESTLAQWKSDSGADANSVTTNPNLSGYAPQSGSSAIGLGANLTSLGITALDSDKAGNARPSSGAWNAGAYQSAGVQPNSPINLTTTVTP